MGLTPRSQLHAEEHRRHVDYHEREAAEHEAYHELEAVALHQKAV